MISGTAGLSKTLHPNPPDIRTHSKKILVKSRGYGSSSRRSLSWISLPEAILIKTVMPEKKRHYHMNLKITLAILLLSFAHFCNAAILASYSFTGYNPISTTSAPDYQAPGIDASDFARSGALTHEMNLGGFTATGWPANANTLMPLNISYYIGFTVTPEVGMTISLTSLDFSETGFSNGIRKFALRSSIDGFNQNIWTISRPNTLTQFNRSLPLDSSFSNLIEPVTFRLYGYEALDPTGGWSVDDFQVNGTVVPEPSSSFLFVLSGVLLSYRRRQRSPRHPAH